MKTDADLNMNTSRPQEEEVSSFFIIEEERLWLQTSIDNVNNRFPSFSSNMCRSKFQTIHVHEAHYLEHARCAASVLYMDNMFVVDD